IFKKHIGHKLSDKRVQFMPNASWLMAVRVGPVFPWVRHTEKSGCFFTCAGSAGETGAEFLNTTCFNDTRLRASVERMGLGSHITFEKRVGFAIQFDGFARVQRGAADDF